MSQPATASPAPTVVTSDDDLRLVLFGRPAAGKSSLLGALGQAAGLQEHLLGGKLLDRTQGLAELGRQLYDETPHPTPEEVVPYPVHYEPATAQHLPPSPVDAVLLDCDGQVAKDILARRPSLDEDSPEGTLAHEIADADALLLVIDASDAPDQVEANFKEFAHFLEAMQESRGKRVEVAGLPVFLVLTKCDLLAQPGDSSLTWKERIEQRKREVGDRFRAFLADQDATKPRPDAQAMEEPAYDDTTDTPFGRLNLHVWATAIKRPPLLQTPAKPREPYGVAELFRQALEEATTYRRRYRRSQRRLTLLVASSVVLVGLLGTLAGVLFVVNAGGRASALQGRVEDIRFFDRGTPAERLKGSSDHLRQTQRKFQEIRDDPQFDRLPADLRTFVEERLGELKAYIPYLETLLSQPSLATVRTEEGLQTMIKKLEDELAPPQESWEDTYAAHLRKERLDSAQAVKRAVQDALQWYQRSADQAGPLWTFADYPEGIDWPEWAGQVEKLLDPNRRPPFRETDPVPNVTGGLMTYAHVLAFDRVAEARRAWDAERTKLSRLLNVTSALGLVPATKARPAVLVLSRDLTLAACKTLVAELKTYYPDYEKAFVRDSLPEAALPRVRQAARRQYGVLLGPGQAEVLKRLQQAGSGSRETPARWEAVRLWLEKPEELTSWRELTRVLLRLDDPLAPEPVQALAVFLGKKRFTVEVQSFTLEVPELRGLVPRAEARLVVLHPESKRQPALAFELSGEPTKDAARRVRVYTYRLSEGRRLVYTPGDKLWAELPLRGDEGRLVWSQSRSSVYQLERLVSRPLLQPVTAVSLDEGRRLDDVRLLPRPEDGVPAVPDLMPQVKLE